MRRLFLLLFDNSDSELQLDHGYKLFSLLILDTYMLNVRINFWHIYGDWTLPVGWKSFLTHCGQAPSLESESRPPA